MTDVKGSGQEVENVTLPVTLFSMTGLDLSEVAPPPSNKSGVKRVCYICVGL